jgi:hypothetical protein
MTSKLSRRILVKGAAGSAMLAGLGMPAIVKAQADAIRIGHLTEARLLPDGGTTIRTDGGSH